VLEEARKASMPATPHALSKLYQYRVPRLSADGSVTLAGEYEAQPYDLSAALGGRSISTTLSLLVVTGFISAVAKDTQLDWVGLYQVRGLPAGRALVKLASRGGSGRAEVPLTAELAARSTTVSVALSGRAQVIADVAAHAKTSGASFERDPKLRTAACLPVFHGAEVVGLVDAAHSQAGAFDDARLGFLVALACEVPTHLPVGA